MSDLTAPPAGLRPPGVRLRNRSNAVAKVAVVLPAGTEIEVPEEVAVALQSQTNALAPVETVPVTTLSTVVAEAPKRRR